MQHMPRDLDIMCSYSSTINTHVYTSIEVVVDVNLSKQFYMWTFKPLDELIHCRKIDVT